MENRSKIVRARKIWDQQMILYYMDFLEAARCFFSVSSIFFASAFSSALLFPIFSRRAIACLTSCIELPGWLYAFAMARQLFAYSAPPRPFLSLSVTYR